MERHLVERLMGNLMPYHFQSKKDMAEKIGIPYRTLLTVCAGNGSRQTAEKVVGNILRYCIREHVPLDTVFPLKLTDKQ